MSELNIIQVQSKKTGRTVQFECDFGANLDEAVEKFGKDIVYSNYAASATIKAQASVRSCLNAVDEAGDVKHTEEEAIALGASFTPTKTTVRKGKDAVQVILDKVRNGEISAEEATAEVALLLAAMAEEA